MTKEIYGPVQQAINERIGACTRIVYDFQSGKLPARDELLSLIGVMEFLGDTNLIYQDLYDSFSHDLDMILAACSESKPNKEPVNVCCICGEEFSGYGNNPQPLKPEGVCCDKCNIKVLLARIETART